MPTTTLIEWTDCTWNSVRGCTGELRAGLHSKPNHAAPTAPKKSAGKAPCKSPKPVRKSKPPLTDATLTLFPCDEEDES